MKDIDARIRLRVLSGAHAGAETDLEPGEYRIGALPSDDICISDWQGASLLIQISGDDLALMSGLEGEALQPLTDGMPLMKGGILIVIASQEAWASDETHWKRWLQEQQTQATQTPPELGKPPTRPHRTRWPWYSVAAITFFVCVGGFISGTAVSARHSGDEAQRARLRSQLEALPNSKLLVEWPDKRVALISGWLSTSQDRVRLSKISANFGDVKVVHRFLVTQEVAMALVQASGNTVFVSPHGLDVFEVTGSVKDLPQVRARLHQALLDLGLSSKNLKDSLLEFTKSPEGLAEAAFHDHGLRYRQLQDGSRVIQITPTTSILTP